jgi:CRP/FNR family transcriptional regulator
MTRHFSTTGSEFDAPRIKSYVMAARCHGCTMQGAALCRAMAESRPPLSCIPTVRRFPKGRVIFEHDAPAGLGVITRGYARRSTMRLDGKRILMELAVPGDIVAALPDQRCACDLEAATEVEMCYYDSHALHWIMQHDHPAISQLLRGIENQHHRLLDALWRYGGLSSRERIIAFLVAAADFMPTRTLSDGSLVLDMEIDRRDWADLTNTAVETISRTLRYLEEKRLVTSLSPYRFQISDLSRLALIAGVEMPEKRAAHAKGQAPATGRSASPDPARRMVPVQARPRPSCKL